MQTKHLCVLIHILTKSEVGAVKLVKALQYNILNCSKVVLLLWIICVIYVLCLSCFHVCLLLPCGHLLGRGWPIVLVTFLCGILGIDSWSLSPFLLRVGFIYPCWFTLFCFIALSYMIVTDSYRIIFINCSWKHVIYPWVPLCIIIFC